RSGVRRGWVGVMSVQGVENRGTVLPQNRSPRHLQTEERRREGNSAWMRHEALPVLSAIVISHNDETTIARAVRSVVNQTCVEPFEVIVVVSGSDGTARVVA